MSQRVRFLFRHAQRGSVDPYGDTVVAQAIEECIDQWLAFKKVVPFGIIEVGCQDGRLAGVAQFHEFEEGIDLFRPERQITNFID